MGPVGARGDPGFEGPMVSCMNSSRYYIVTLQPNMWVPKWCEWTCCIGATNSRLSLEFVSDATTSVTTTE